MADDDIIELQSRLMDMERQVQELSDVVAEQWKVIDALKGSVLQHKDRIGVLESAQNDKKKGDSSIEEARENIPPHY